MMIIKWILLIALFKYSHGETLDGDRAVTHPPKSTNTITTPLPHVTCVDDQQCVDFLLCDVGTVDEDGNYLFDDRTRSPCPLYTDVCCQPSDIKTKPTEFAPNNKVPTKCGVLNQKGVGLTLLGTNDHEAQFGEFPWMVAVMKKTTKLDKTKHEYHCGGSLIHPSVVLTSGHKIVAEKFKNLYVRAGEWDTKTTREPLTHVESNVASIKTHANFQKGSGTYYIGLLFLKTPIENTKHISTICLPPPQMNFDGASCFVTGWGKDKFGDEGVFRTLLKKFELPVVTRQKCQEMFRNTRLGESFVLNESFICAGGEEGKDACSGDGGSPLVCPVPGNEGYYYQAGIVAWGIGCGDANIPGTYTNVAFYADWIEEQIKNKGYKTTSYTF